MHAHRPLAGPIVPPEGSIPTSVEQDMPELEGFFLNIQGLPPQPPTRSGKMIDQLQVVGEIVTALVRAALFVATIIQQEK